MNARFDFSENQLISLVLLWKRKLAKQRMLLDIPNQKILVVGDIHGDLLQLERAISLLDSKTVDAIIFDGDIIDRGPEMVECLLLLIKKQLLDNANVYYLRGNHELSAVNAVYGFRGYCTALFGSRVYTSISQAFQQLPLAAKIGDSAFVAHGGVPRDPIYFHLMRLDLKPKEPEKGPYAELIWNDPDNRLKGYGRSMRGGHCYRFGTRAFETFMEFHNLKLFIRAHQAFPKGYKWFFEKRLLSVFSSKAGPYSRVNPHFAIIHGQDIELIKTKSVEL